MYVLVVEDSTKLRRALERWLEAKGHTICWASTGVGAIRQLCTEGDKLDVVLLDMILEDHMSGWDVARFIYFDNKLRRIPLIILTGLSSEIVHEQARVNVLDDALGIIEKPLDMKHLEALLNIAAEKKDKR